MEALRAVGKKRGQRASVAHPFPPLFHRFPTPSSERIGATERCAPRSITRGQFVFEEQPEGPPGRKPGARLSGWHWPGIGRLPRRRAALKSHRERGRGHGSMGVKIALCATNNRAHAWDNVVSYSAYGGLVPIHRIGALALPYFLIKEGVKEHPPLNAFLTRHLKLIVTLKF